MSLCPSAGIAIPSERRPAVMGLCSRNRLAGTTMNELTGVGKPWRLMLAVNAAVMIGVFWQSSRCHPTSPTFICWSTIISASPNAR